jgi:hypothetical protein
MAGEMNNNHEEIEALEGPAHFDSLAGLQEKRMDQQEGSNSMNEIREGEAIIEERLSKTDISKLNNETKNDLTLLGKFKRMFKGRSPEEKYEERLAFIKSHGTKGLIYAEIEKQNPDLAKKYVDIAAEGIPKVTRDSEGKITGVEDATRYENIN